MRACNPAMHGSKKHHVSKTKCITDRYFLQPKSVKNRFLTLITHNLYLNGKLEYKKIIKIISNQYIKAISQISNLFNHNSFIYTILES